MLSFEDRVNFYLGYELIKSGPLNIDICNATKEKFITISDLIEADTSFCERYIISFKKLLKKTNNSGKKFICAFGDISHTTSLITLCKNRADGNNNSVLLRCLNYVRHWSLVYTIPVSVPFDKKISKVFWRGSTTGCPNRLGNRFSMVTKWFNTSDKIDVGFTSICQKRGAYSSYVKKRCNVSTFLEYKYILSIEGNDKDSGINWKLNSNSLVLMAKPRVCSWLMETTLIPDYHYIILKDDFSDLEEKVDWCNDNPHICETIIKNANNFMSQFIDETVEEKIEEAVINKYFDTIKSINL